MLDSVTAIRFDRRITSGKTRPCLLVCERANGEELEVIAKFSAGCERKCGGLIAEAISAMLAADLNLPIPEPVLVNFDQEFINLLPPLEHEMAAQMNRSVFLAFGSAKLPAGFSLVIASKAIQPSMRNQAAEIFAFDALIQNSDRRVVNPNCLSDGRDFAIIDHELAFITDGIIGWQPPWVPGSQESLRGMNPHLFYPMLMGHRYDLSRLQTAWQMLSDARLGEYQDSLPSEWMYDNNVAGGCLDYIARVRDNIGPSIAEITRILS